MTYVSKIIYKIEAVQKIHNVPTYLPTYLPTYNEQQKCNKVIC